MSEMSHEDLEGIWNRIKVGESIEAWHGTTICDVGDQLTNDMKEVWLRDSNRIWRPAFFTANAGLG